MGLGSQTSGFPPGLSQQGESQRSREYRRGLAGFWQGGFSSSGCGRASGKPRTLSLEPRTLNWRDGGDNPHCPPHARTQKRLVHRAKLASVFGVDAVAASTTAIVTGSHGFSGPVTDCGIVRVEVGKFRRRPATGAIWSPVGVAGVQAPDDAAASLGPAVAVFGVAVKGFPDSEPGLVELPETLWDRREFWPPRRAAVETRGSWISEHFHRGVFSNQ